MLGMENYQLPKPAPEPYFLLAEMLDIDPATYDTTFIFEDSKTGLRAAAATGMRVVGMTTAYDEKTLEEFGAEFTIKNLAEAVSLWV